MSMNWLWLVALHSSSMLMYLRDEYTQRIVMLPHWDRSCRWNMLSDPVPTGPTSPSTDPVTPGAWQGSHLSTKLRHQHDSTWQKATGEIGVWTQVYSFRGGRLTMRPPRRSTYMKQLLHWQQVIFVCWLLNVQATCECISGTGLLRHLYVLPHWDRSCRSNFPSHPVTVYWHRVNQSQHWPYNARRLAG